ncbi:MAG: hypothetical protein WC449_00040 [Candidatus Paceibacterota bacterium]
MKNRYIFVIIFAAALLVFWQARAQMPPPSNMGCKGGGPNGVCDLGEMPETCMSDCVNNYGCVGGNSNGQCEVGENSMNCVNDCGGKTGEGTCGNGVCDNPGDILNGCPTECIGGGIGGGGIGGGCTSGLGNGICDPGETIEGCSNDCECDSDKVCEAPKENKTVCPTDCGCNHNGVCEKSNSNGFDETAGNCSDDCGWECSSKRPYYRKDYCNSNGKCEKDVGENFETCKKDCGLDYKSFSSWRYPDCNTIKTGSPSDIICDYDGKCESGEENCYDCVSWVDPYNSSIVHTDGRCNNNGICESQFESGYTCCDCGEVYCNHNGICENQTNDPLGNGSMETSSNCPDDCPNYCNNNGRCESFWELPSGGVTTTPPKPTGFIVPKPAFIEDNENCRFDCPCNKNGICEPNFWEDANNCSDCSNIDCKNLSSIGSATRCDDKLSGYSETGGGPYNCFADPPAQCEKGEAGKAWLNTGCNYDGICQPSACEGVGNCPDCSYLCGDGVCQQSAGSKQLINEKGDLLSFSLINWKIDRLGELGTREAGETPGNCYKDCYVGDLTYWPGNSTKICNWQGDGGIKEPENTDNSPIDCLCNADGKCDPWEGPKECRSDCVCDSDGVCEKGGAPLDKIECDDNDPDSANHCGECYKGIYIHYPKNPAKLSLNSSGKLSNSSMRSTSYGGSSWAMDVFVRPCWRPLTGTVIVSSKIGTVSGYSDCFDDAKSEEFFREMKKFCDTGVWGVNLWDYKRDCKQLPLPWYFPESAGIVSKNDFSYDVARCGLAPTSTYYCKGVEWFKYQGYNCPARKDAKYSGPYWPSFDYSEELCPSFDFALKSFKDTEHNVYSLGSMSYIIGSPDEIKSGVFKTPPSAHDTDIDFADYVNSTLKDQCENGEINPCDNDTVCEPEKGENFYNCYYDCACPRIRNYQFGLVYQRQGCLSVSEKTWDEQKSGCRKDCGSCGDGYCQKEAQEKYSITLTPTGDTPSPFDPANPQPPPPPPLPPCAGGLVEYKGTRGSDNAKFLCSRVSPNIAGNPIDMFCQNCSKSEIYLCGNFGEATGTCHYSVTDEMGATTYTELDYITSGKDRELVYKEEAWCAPGETTCAWQAGESGESCNQDCMLQLGVKTLEATSVTPYSADLRMNISGWGKDGTPGEYWFEYWEADTVGERQQSPHLVTSKYGTTTINVLSLKNNTKYYFIPYIRSKFGSADASRVLMQGEQFSFQTLKGKCGTIIIDEPKNNSYVYPDEVAKIQWRYERLAAEDSDCDDHYKMQILDGENLDSVLDVLTPKDLSKGTFEWGSPKTSDRSYKIRIIGYSATEDDMTNPADLNLVVPKLPITKDWWASGSGLCNAGLPFINFGFNFENLLPDNGRGLVATFKLYNQSDVSLPSKLAEEDISGKQVGIFSLSNYCADNDRKYYLTATLKWHGEAVTVPPDSNGLDTKEVVLDDHKPPTVGFSYTIELDGKLDLHAYSYPPPDSNSDIEELRWYVMKEDFQSIPRKNPITDKIDGESDDWWLLDQDPGLLKTGIWLEAFDNIGDDPYSCATSILPDSGFRNVRFRENPEL